MKRAISLILVLMLCLSLCACGKTSKEEMLTNAQDFPSSTFFDDCKSNIALAKDKYIGKIYRRTSIVTEITEKGCYAGTSGNIFIPLDKDALLKQAVDQSIEYVFKIDDIVVEEDENRLNYNIVAKNVHYIGNVSQFDAEVMWILSNDALVFIPGIGYCAFDLELTSEQASAYPYRSMVRLEGTVCRKKDAHQYQLPNGNLEFVDYTMQNAVLIAP